MVCDVTPSQVFELAGHDGCENLWPHLPEPTCRRGHVISEMVMVAWKLGHFLVPVIPCWPAVPKEGETPFDVKLSERWVSEMILMYSGIMIGFTLSGSYHAVAWDQHRKLILDPNGTSYGLEHFKLESFWARVR